MRLLLWYLLLAYVITGCTFALHLDPTQLDLLMEERDAVEEKAQPQDLPAEHTGGHITVPSAEESARLGGGKIVDPYALDITPLTVLCRGGPGAHLAFPCGLLLSVRSDGSVVGYGRASNQPRAVPCSPAVVSLLDEDMGKLRVSVREIGAQLHGLQAADDRRTTSLERECAALRTKLSQLQERLAYVESGEGIRMADRGVDTAETTHHILEGMRDGLCAEVLPEGDDGTATQLFIERDSGA